MTFLSYLLNDFFSKIFTLTSFGIGPLLAAGSFRTLSRVDFSWSKSSFISTIALVCDSTLTAKSSKVFFRSLTRSPRSLTDLKISFNSRVVTTTFSRPLPVPGETDWLVDLGLSARLRSELKEDRPLLELPVGEIRLLVVDDPKNDDVECEVMIMYNKSKEELVID